MDDPVHQRSGLLMWLRRRDCLCSLLVVLCLLSPGCNNGTPPTPVPGGDPVPPDSSRRSLEKADYERAIVLRNRGIGHLENKEWDDAEKALSQLAELLPENRLAVRNLAVSRVLALIDRESPFTRSGPPENAARFDAAVSAAREAVQAFKDNASEAYDRALADLLMGKLLMHQSSPESPTVEQGLASLKAAADAMPQAADFRFAVAMAMDGDRDYSDPRSPKSAQLLEALGQSFDLAPQNLFALQKLLQRQALFLNAQDESVKKMAQQITVTLRAATDLLAPLNESIKKQRRMDLVDTITKSLDSFDGTNTTPLMQPAMVTANLLLPEIATQIDQRRLNKNLLEYLLPEFDADFVTAARESGAIPAPEPTVIKAFVTGNGLPEIEGVTQVDMLDMNLDGFDDLIVAREGKIEIYSRGTDVSAAWQLLLTSPDTDVPVAKFLLADIDRDFDKAISDVKTPSILRDADGDQKIVTDPAGENRWYDTDPDIIGWSNKGVVVFRNNTDDKGTRTLETLPQEEALPDVNDVVAADLEADGDLDLIFATDSGMTLWKNIDGTVFQNANESASLPDHELRSLAIADWNSDVAIDVVGVSSSGEQFGYLQNMLHGRFRWQAEQRDNPPSAAFELVARTDEIGWKVIGPKDLQTDQPATHILTGDFDNDGMTDAVCISETNTVFARGNPDGSFEKTELMNPPSPVQTATAADIDDDGDLDLVYVTSDGGSLGLLTNDGGNTNNWIDVVARAVPDDPQFPSNRVNMHGIGSVIEMRAGGLYHAEVITKPKIHLGLGNAESADAIRIIWTDGIPQNVTVPKLLKPRIGILAPQILKGSCPYIYTWTGERFEFFSDCLWAAPLGLVQATGDLAPTREWENLLIPGSSLVEKDGQYILQLTEELWETAYFDQVKLTAIDHPVGTDIFTNEKVGPPSMAAHRVHTVKNPQLPLSITDSRGRDLLPELTSQDGNYVQAFEGRIMQGLTDEWVMEFDLGNLASDRQDDKAPSNSANSANSAPPAIRLFLTGWVFPTDTSLNLAIAQNPDLQPPAPPSIEVPDGRGGWKTARPFIGFPSGKTKAMVVDISDIFENDDYRFRMKSSMELYWDQAFFTVNEEDAETIVQTCPLNSSDLHYRGFSHRIYADNTLFRNGRAPESYDYDSVTTDPRWPPISGRFTSYGDTTALVSDHDDQMVVMGPGDELTVCFAAPLKPVRKGWKRDFVLTNAGYDKDADLNTVYGQSSEPYPFRSMTRYPFAEDDRVPNSREYLRHLDARQTRRYSSRAFWNAFRNSETANPDE